MKMNGSQILIQALIDQGVDTIFGYPGGSVLNIYDALYERSEDIRHIITSHEQGAAHAADGYARSTGKCGVCLATSGRYQSGYRYCDSLYGLHSHGGHYRQCSQ